MADNSCKISKYENTRPSWEETQNFFQLTDVSIVRMSKLALACSGCHGGTLRALGTLPLTPLFDGMMSYTRLIWNIVMILMIPYHCQYLDIMFIAIHMIRLTFEELKTQSGSRVLGSRPSTSCSPQGPLQYNDFQHCNCHHHWHCHCHPKLDLSTLDIIIKNPEFEDQKNAHTNIFLANEWARMNLC